MRQFTANLTWNLTMHYIRTALILVSMFLSTIALAENSSNYIGINMATFDSKYSSVEHDGAMINLGYDVSNYFALEVAGGASETYEDPTTSDTSKIDSAVSAFLRFNIRLNRVTLYFLGGYSRVESTSTVGGVGTSTIDESGSYGYGIDFYGTRDLALSVRRVIFVDSENTAPVGNRHIAATMIGITYYFDTPKIHSRY